MYLRFRNAQRSRHPGVPGYQRRGQGRPWATLAVTQHLPRLTTQAGWFVDAAGWQSFNRRGTAQGVPPDTTDFGRIPRSNEGRSRSMPTATWIRRILQRPADSGRICRGRAGDRLVPFGPELLTPFEWRPRLL